jgi:hypothetical protein
MPYTDEGGEANLPQAAQMDLLPLWRSALPTLKEIREKVVKK